MMNDKATTLINIDYFQEIKANSDKWLEKETPFIPTEQEWYGFVGFMGFCRCYCKTAVQDNYCSNCGQKLDWESEDAQCT
jgi:hypothetical protein